MTETNRLGNNIILRQYTHSDVEGILCVFKTSIEKLCARDYSPSQISAWTKCADKEAWNAQFLSRHTTVAVADGVVVGFCDTERNGHIDRLYVSPDYAGKGIGKALVKDAETAVEKKTVSVEASITAKPFFEKLGYTLAERQTVIRHGESLTNYRMSRSL